eukprot:XP_011447657.1 PREDICTED: uncharacterized protein LOC105342407 isoform X2 [Crassostrea gigas]
MQFCWLTVFLISLLFPTLKCYDKLENRNVHVQTRILLNDPNLLNSRMEAMERELQTLKTKLHAQESETQDLKHQLESRTSELLEMKTSGFSAGGLFNAKGSATTTLCLPHDPDAAPAGVPFSLHYGVLYGSEYEFGFKNIAYNDDVPCAVCFNSQAASIMIPAKSSCPSSWTKQYAGFLTSGGSYSDHYGAEYLCLDENPEYMTDGARQHDENGRLFYPVHAVCGSLPCPPYQNSQTIACVVCTK